MITKDVIIKLNLDEILTKVAQDVISEIKRLIKSGKNINNQSLQKKSDGNVPDFDETGMLLKSITYEIKDGGIDIFIGDAKREQVAEYLKLKNSTWVIISESDYIKKFMDDRLQFYLDEEIN